MKKLCLLAALVLWSSSAYAQPRPMAATTLTVTNTSNEAIRVGCPVGSGTCTGGIVAGVVDTGLITSGGAIGIASSVPAVTTMKLYNNSGTLTWNGIALATGASLSGTTNKLAVFTAANAVGDSMISQNVSATIATVAGTMVATTFSGSGASLTAVPAGQLTGTIPNATQDLITRLGIVTSGTWQGSIVPNDYGGTSANLSGTGGVSQFLRQNSAGAAITVVRPNVADLSDASNLALLNAANTFTNAAVATQVFNSTAANGGYLTVQRSGVGKAYLGVALPLLGVGTNDDATLYTDNVLWLSGDGGINFADIGVKRWGINAAGAWTVGASANIADGIGTPTVASGCGGAGAVITAGGRSYAFQVVLGAAPGTPTCTVNLGTTYAAAPICVSTPGAGTPGQSWIAIPSTTQVILAASIGAGGGDGINVICRGT